jgi:hypothetical protein
MGQHNAVDFYLPRYVMLFNKNILLQNFSEAGFSTGVNLQLAFSF